jgi:hypothetical protein
MPLPPTGAHWTRTMDPIFPHLSRPQRSGLALWVWGVLLVRSVSLTSVAAALAGALHRPAPTVQARLREWYLEADTKRGTQRQSLDVTGCFAPLLGWILSLWPTTDRRLPLALDATSLGDRYTILVVRVVYRGTALPIAWKVLPAGQSGPWQPHWIRLLAVLAPALPGDWQVLVLADRGLYAPWLFRHIVALGWHPGLRINRGFQVSLDRGHSWLWLWALLGPPPTAWKGTLWLGKDRHSRLVVTLLLAQEPDHADPWLVVTDLPASEAEVVWYRLRSWIEQGFRDLKTDGWSCQRTRLATAARVERQWLVLAVATLVTVSLAEPSDEQVSAQESVFIQGYRAVLRRIWGRRDLHCKPLRPLPWPTTFPAPHRSPSRLSRLAKHKT